LKRAAWFRILSTQETSTQKANMSTMASKLPSYPDVLNGDASLPDDIRAIANLRHRVVAWTTLDPNHESEVDGYVCGRTFGMLAILPCFWPHLLLCLPCLCAAKVNSVNTIRGQYWILTETELKVIVTRHNAGCIPGCCEVGDMVQTIPLENITDCGVSGRATGLVNRCAGSLPEIYVDTASVTQGKIHEATGIALAQHELFVQAILNQRDVVKGCAVGSPNAMVAATAVYPEMERGAERPTADRIKEITTLYESGVLTKDEFDKKRQEIIDSI
jgi:hypothetical protein